MSKRDLSNMSVADMDAWIDETTLPGPEADRLSACYNELARRLREAEQRAEAAEAFIGKLSVSARTPFEYRKMATDYLLAARTADDRSTTASGGRSSTAQGGCSTGEVNDAR